MHGRGRPRLHDPVRLLFWLVGRIHQDAWLFVVASAALQVLIFPLPNFYILSWVAVTPLLVALLRARRPNTLQLTEGIHLLPATPGQAFLLGYVCGIIWYAGTCYWIFATMRQYGGLSTFAAVGVVFLFCLYLALYHGLFGLLIGLLASKKAFSSRALLLSPAVWVGVELARTRITAFPWDLLGICQVDNIPLARIAAVTGVYGISFEIMVVNAAFASAFLLRREARKKLLVAAFAAAIVLQGGQWIPAPPSVADHTARLVQQDLPVGDEVNWTKHEFTRTLNEFVGISLMPIGKKESRQPDLIVWPESPAPFFTSDPVLHSSLADVADKSHAWLLIGMIGIDSTKVSFEHAQTIYNSAELISPAGEYMARYDKMHLVPFGEYVPFQTIFSFAGGLTKEVGDFTHGKSNVPLDAGGKKLGVFICYESIFPDEVRRKAAGGAQLFVNISNDGWYGDSGAFAQHLRQARMRAIENARWLLRDTNTGVTAAVDPYGRIAGTMPRKLRGSLDAPYALSDVTTLYTRYGDWFAYLCAIITLVALIVRFTFWTEEKANDDRRVRTRIRAVEG